MCHFGVLVVLTQVRVSLLLARLGLTARPYQEHYLGEDWGVHTGGGGPGGAVVGRGKNPTRWWYRFNLPGEGAHVCARRWKFEKIGDNGEGKWMLVAAYGNDGRIMPVPQGKTLEDSRLEIPKGQKGSVWAWETEEDYVWNGKEQSVTIY